MPTNQDKILLCLSFYRFVDVSQRWKLVARMHTQNSERPQNVKLKNAQSCQEATFNFVQDIFNTFLESILEIVFNLRFANYDL